MIYLIDSSNKEYHQHNLTEMFKLRFRVFSQNLKWKVTGHDGLEIDEYDNEHANYLVYADSSGRIKGCLRFIEMIHPCMFDGPFNFSLNNLQDFKRKNYWELSRLAIDQDVDENYTYEEMQLVGLKLLQAYMLFGMELQKVECTLTIGYPKVIQFYKEQGLIFKSLNKICIDEDKNEIIEVAAFPTLNYCYDQYSLKTNLVNSNIFWYTCPVTKEYNT